MKRVAILGEIGGGNLGDDLGYFLLRDELMAAFRELDIHVDIHPVSPNALLTKEQWHLAVLGCGTLLDEVGYKYVTRLLDAAREMPVVILGTGMADPNFAPPTPEGTVALQRLLEVSLYSWRRAVNGPDTGWLAGWLRPDDVAVTRERTFGLNYGPAAHNTMPVDAKILRTVRKELRGASVPIAAFHADLAYLEPLIYDQESVLIVDGSRAAFERLARLSAVFCLRIHLGVFAACCGVHPVLLDYSRKVREVFMQTRVPHTILGPRFTVDAIVRALETGVAPTREVVEAAQAVCRDHVRRAAYAVSVAWSWR